MSAAIPSSPLSTSYWQIWLQLNRRRPEIICQNSFFFSCFSKHSSLGITSASWRRLPLWKKSTGIYRQIPFPFPFPPLPCFALSSLYEFFFDILMKLMLLPITHKSILTQDLVAKWSNSEEGTAPAALTLQWNKRQQEDEIDCDTVSQMDK